MPRKSTVKRARQAARAGKARRAGVELPVPKKGTTSDATRKKAKGKSAVSTEAPSKQAKQAAQRRKAVKKIGKR